MFQIRLQIPGVFVTASVLAIILLRWVEKFTPGHIANLLYGAVLFSSVILVYSVDHLFDLIKYEQKNKAVNSQNYLNIVIIVISAACLGALITLGAAHFDFKHIWIPLIPSFLYVFTSLKVLPFIRGFKEVVIAITVASAIGYPLISSNFGMFIQLLIPTFIVCLMNLFLFGFFEKNKDEFYGFKTIYAGVNNYAVFKHLWISFLVFSALLVVAYVFVGNLIFPYWAIAVLYWLMLLFNKKIADLQIYRWLADIILIFLILI